SRIPPTRSSLRCVPLTRALRTRAVSALILASVALIAAYRGRPVWDALVAVLGALMAWEWARLCSGGRPSRVGMLSIAIAPVAAALGVLAGVTPALVFVGAGVVIIGLGAKLEGTRNPLWLAAGVGYVGLPCIALAWLRALPHDGLATLLWVLAV